MRAERRLLLDTHTYLWWRLDSPRLADAARDAIGGAALVFVSVASAWEAAIKVSLGKLKLNETVQEGIADSGFEQLPVTLEHTELIARLPLHHRDPFDRMLVAQCLSERLVLVTHDRQIEPYGAEIIWT